MKTKIRVATSASFFNNPWVLDMLSTCQIIFTGNLQAVGCLDSLLPNSRIIGISGGSDLPNDTVSIIVDALRGRMCLGDGDLEIIRFGELRHLATKGPACKSEGLLRSSLAMQDTAALIRHHWIETVSKIPSTECTNPNCTGDCSECTECIDRR